ncbi:MAG: ExbD/TolR family protein [Opitutales bacterium]
MPVDSQGERSAGGPGLPGSLASPLGLARYQRWPSQGFDPVPWLDLLVIALFGLMLQSELVFNRGATVDLPSLNAGMTEAARVSAVLTYREGMFIFEGAPYQIDNLDRGFTRFFEEATGPLVRENPVLLVKLERSLDLERFLEVAVLARSAGFDQVQVAAFTEEPPAADLDGLIESP